MMPPAPPDADGAFSATQPIIYVNGSRHVLPPGRGGATLLQYLRDDLRLTGTKLVCGEGGCGACTVTLVDRDLKGEVRARPVNACLFPLYSAEGAAVVTVEGLKNEKSENGSPPLLHPLPAALAGAHGSQCGFCSPGFVMAAHSCLAAHAVRKREEEGRRREGEREEEGEGKNGNGENGENGGTKRCPAASASASSPSPSPSCSLSGNNKPAEDIEDVFSGNLCRCTGYRPIVDAFRAFFDEGGGEGEGEEEKAFPSSSEKKEKKRFAPPARPGEGGEEGAALSPSSSSSSPIVDPSSLLPRELLTRTKPELHFPASEGRGESGGAGVEWRRPTSLRSLLSLVSSSVSSSASPPSPPCTFIGGNTEVGIECAQKGLRHSLRIDVGSVPELAELDFSGGGGKGQREKDGGNEKDGKKDDDGFFVIGAGVTLEDLLSASKAASLSSFSASAVSSQLRRFAGRAVRAAAVVGGNVVTASPASDLNPVLVACGASFDLASLKRDPSSFSPGISIRSVPAGEFFLGYRRVDLRPEEVLLRARLPRWSGDGGAFCSSSSSSSSSSSPSRRPLDFVQSFKQARRRDDDISIVTACLAVRFEARRIEQEEEEGSEKKEASFVFVVSQASFCFGGVAATPLPCPAASRALVGSRWGLEDYNKALKALTERDVLIAEDAPGGAVPYRRALVASAFARFFAAAHSRVAEVVSSSSSSPSVLLPPPALPAWLSAASEGLPSRPPPRSLQYYDGRGGGEEETKAASSSPSSSPSSPSSSRVIGVPVQHLSADLQASGKARYVADEPLLPGTLHGALVLSTRAAATVASIDPSRAVSSSSSFSPIFFFGAADVPGENRWGPLLGDPLFVGVGERSEAVGLPLGIVVARSEQEARRAALLVEVEYLDDDNDESGNENGERSDGDGRTPTPSSSSKKSPILTIEDAIAAGSFFPGMDREIDHGEGSIDELLERYRREAAAETKSGDGGGDDGEETKRKKKKKRLVRAVRGSIRIGGQEHFYLEAHSALAVPGERGTSTELEVLSSTQAPSGTQLDVARAVGLPLHAVVCRATRLGGGFGGKETRAGGVAAAAGVAAVLTGRPVRLVLERHVDAAISGGRHPFYVEWEVAAEVVSNNEEEEEEEDGEGANGTTTGTAAAQAFQASSSKTSNPTSKNLSARILAADLRLFSNAGCSPDLSGPVMERALMHCANAYAVPRLRAKGRVARTNATSNTAFRGFGAPQGMLAFEAAVEQAAGELGVEPEVLREGSMLRNGDTTPYGTVMTDCQARACWEECLRSSGFAARRREIDEFNRKSRWIKRGLAALPTMFGVSFTHKTYNQAGAQVSVFAADGSVLVSHGGVEMGQGLHTKVAAVAAAALGVVVLRGEGEGGEKEGEEIVPLPLSAVKVASATRTDSVPNASPTAASASSDLYGGAVADACAQLMQRLRPYLLKAAAAAAAAATAAAEAPSSATTKQGAAEGGKTSPSPPSPSPSTTVLTIWKAAVAAAYADRVDLCAHGFYSTPGLGGWGSGAPFAYSSFGAAAVEVAVDCLTGDSAVTRADIVMDVGRSLNPAIDVGQVEGAFVQGMGWATTEEVVKCDGSHSWVGRGNGRGRGKSFQSSSSSAAAAASAASSLTPLDGSTHTRGPGTYKIPAADDAPSDFRVSLLRGSRNAATAKTVHSSKAVGEPPFFLGAAAFFALKRAVGAARADAFEEEGRGVEGREGEEKKEEGERKAFPSPPTSFFRLDLPATSEALRLSAAGIDADGDESESNSSNDRALDAVAGAAGVRGRRSRVSC